MAHTNDNRLAVSLALFRVSTAVLFAVWAFQKILLPEGAAGVFAKYYSADIATSLIVALGIAQLAVIAGFALGAFKRVTYGAILLMHLASTLVTIPNLLNPFQSPNLLFYAGLPVLAGLVGLYLLRDSDTLTIGALKRGLKSQEGAHDALSQGSAA